LSITHHTRKQPATGPSRAHAEALSARQAGKEFVSEYNSDSNPAFGYYSDSSYEFDFRADPDEHEFENHTTEQPLSGPASGLVITSTPAGRFVYWPDRKPAYLTDGNSRCVAYLDSLPFQEVIPLAPAEEHTPTEVATSDSSLGSPDRQVFMTTNETPVLTPTIGTRKGLTCGPSLVKTRHSAGNFPQRIR
jgi:hypothetical protein